MMAIQYAHDKNTASGTIRLLVSAAMGAIALLIASKILTWHFVPLIGWDVAVVVYLGWMWHTIYGLTGSQASKFALREDPSRGIADFILLFVSVASLGAVALVLLSGSGDTTQRVLGAGLGVLSVLLSWVLTHTIFMLRYAELYYSDSPGGVEFTGTTEPTFTDFAYLAFTMGMTFQVSDTGFKSTAFRSLALRHALLSYLFGTVIVATTINLVAGLSK